MIRNFYSIFFSLVACIFYGQEGTKPLGSNLNYIYTDLAPRPVKVSTDVGHNKTAAASVSYTLPFIEDFYYSTTSNYPDTNKWSDSTVYINSGMGIAPPSIGVATFDGLNKHGYPYNPSLVNLATSQPGDVLTSQPINLRTVGQVTLDPAGSNVAISFYYQARGRGDSPEISDSLVLDFYKPISGKWQKAVWFAQGNINSNINDTVFKRAFVRVKDTAYFHDGFKFRFRNWASPTGNFDHWHVDYIFLDQGRGDSLADTVRNDISFGGVPTSFLRDYSEMPFQQYNANEMAGNLDVRIRNNSGIQVNIGYKYRIRDDKGTLIFPEYNGGFDNLNPFWKNTFTPLSFGWSKVQAHAKPNIKDSFLLPGPNRFNYEITHTVFLGTSSVTTGDIIKENNEVVQYQFFRDFYAYDDGSAEAGYYVDGAQSKIALKLKTNVLDTLKALRIYFEPVGNVSVISNTLNSVYVFTISVWALGANGEPGNLIYNDSVKSIPFYSQNGFKEVPEFKLKHSLVLGPGTYFIGIQQAASTITIGFDRNYDHHTNLYYNTSNVWKQSEETGSLMMRPVFSNKIVEVVGLNEFASEKEKFLMFPNPSSEKFTIVSGRLSEASYQLYSSMGQLVDEGLIDGAEHVVSTSSLIPGMYILILKTKGEVIQQQKMIIQH